MLETKKTTGFYCKDQDQPRDGRLKLKFNLLK